jgi:hypothetical protein
VKKYYPAIVLMVFLSAAFTSCIFVPVIEGFNQTGITAGQRSAKLAKTVNTFQDYVFWGDVNKALEFAEPDKRSLVAQAIRRLPKDERVVDAKMLLADYPEDAYDANVVVRSKSYDKTTLKVHERDVEQKWVFYMGSGWKISEFHEIPFGSRD